MIAKYWVAVVAVAVAVTVTVALALFLSALFWCRLSDELKG
jgi:hypothetical protein